MTKEDISNLTILDLLIHPDPAIRKAAQELIELLLKKESPH